MTANTTPRLGLMAPVNADVFTPDDFTATFTKLDGTPGVSMVDSYGGLPTGLTNAQHGSLYLQRDIRAMWMWSQPTAGSVGGWIRTNSLGVLAASGLPAPVATANPVQPGVRVLGTSATVPGGRYLFVYVAMPIIQCSSPYQMCVIWLYVNGSGVARRHIPVSGPTQVSSASLQWGGVFPAGSTVTADLYISTWASGAVNVSPDAFTSITIYEV